MAPEGDEERCYARVYESVNLLITTHQDARTLALFIFLSYHTLACSLLSTASRLQDCMTCLANAARDADADVDADADDVAADASLNAADTSTCLRVLHLNKTALLWHARTVFVATKLSLSLSSIEKS